MSVVLSVQNLVQHFPIAGSRSLVQAVNNVSFTVARGETLSLDNDLTLEPMSALILELH